MRPPLDLGWGDTWSQPSALPLAIRQPSADLVGCLLHIQPSAGHRAGQRYVKRYKEFTASSGEEADTQRAMEELESPYEVAMREGSSSQARLQRKVREKGADFLMRRTV